MIRIVVIGLGNAGNQVANLAYLTKGIPALAINSSEKDLFNVSIEKIHIGTQGSGKDRNIAKEYLKENFVNMYESGAIQKFVMDAEVIFIVSSTGGGSGSGVSPVFSEMLSKMFPGKKIIIIGILPEIRESIASQQNTVEYIKELKSINRVTYMLYDNNRRSHLPTSQILKNINEEIVEDMCIIRGDYQYSTPFNSIDEKDMFKILNTPGALNISKIYDLKEKDMDNVTIEDMLIQYLKNKSSMCEIERDGIVKRLGLITNLNEKLQKYIDKRLLKLKEVIGEPLEGFEHDYIIKSSDETNRVILFLSGLSIPDDRIEKISQRIEEVTEALMKTKEGSYVDNVDDDIIKELRKEDVVEAVGFDLDDIFSKFIKE